MYIWDYHCIGSKDCARFQPREDPLSLSYLLLPERKLDAWFLFFALVLAIALRYRHQRPRLLRLKYNKCYHASPKLYSEDNTLIFAYLYFTTICRDNLGADCYVKFSPSHWLDPDVIALKEYVIYLNNNLS